MIGYPSERLLRSLVWPPNLSSHELPLFLSGHHQPLGRAVFQLGVILLQHRRPPGMKTEASGEGTYPN